MRPCLLPAATVALALALGVGCVVADERRDSEHHRFQVTVLTEELSHPWALAFLPGGDMLVTERGGRLVRLEEDGGGLTEIGGVPEVAVANQGGLLDIALHPAFSENRLVYLSYSASTNEGNATTIGRGRLQGDRLEDFQVLFQAEPATGGGRHFGSRLLFDHDGYLYVTSGDRGQRDLAQDPSNHYGTVLRLHDDGSVPDDNPLAGDGHGRPEIYTWGHRNPQGMILHPDTGEVWIHEHGPRGGDELNILRAGRNYGWPKVTHGREYHGPELGVTEMEGMEPAIHHWTPSIAPSGMAYYDGNAFPEWQGNLFVGALAMTHLARVELDGDKVVHEERLLNGDGWRVRDVRQGPDGNLYLLVDAGTAPLLRLSPAD